MKKIAITACMIMAATAPPALAYEDITSRQSDTVLGFYFTMPFDGGLRTKYRAAPLEYGLRLQIRDNYRSFRGTRSQNLGFQADALSLKFGQNGFDNFAISGKDVIEYNTITFNADGSADKSDGSVNWLWVGLGVGAAAIVVSAAIVADDIEDTFENILSDPNSNN